MNVPPGETDAEKGPSAKARTPPNDTFTMVRHWIVHKFVVCHRVERKTHNVVRQNCLGEAHLRRHKSWENSKFKALDSYDQCTRTSATTQSTTRLCSSEKRMQTIAWRAPGKDPRRMPNHSSQSTNKTAKNDNNLRATKNMTTQLRPKTCSRFYKGSRWNLQTNSSRSQANLHTASLWSSTWDQTHWKTSNWNTKHSSSPDNWCFFSQS